MSLQREENSVHCENICLCKCKETNMKYLHQYVHLNNTTRLFQIICTKCKYVFSFAIRKPLTWMSGKLATLKCCSQTVDNDFFFLEMSHLLVFSVHTSPSVLA